VLTKSIIRKTSALKRHCMKEAGDEGQLLGVWGYARWRIHTASRAVAWPRVQGSRPLACGRDWLRNGDFFI
jgi:hypothetical protein